MPTRRLTLSTFVLALASLAPLAYAQAPHPNGSTIPTGHRTAVPAAAAAQRAGDIAIDGKANDAAWAAATPITEFTQFDPDEGKPGTQKTEVRFLYDADALYVAARMYDTMGPAGIRTRLARRDATTDSDWFQIVVDAYHDHLGRAFFQVNPSGVKFDALGIGTSGPDPAWDPIWEVATSIDNEGWTAEMRIPLSQLRFPRDSVQTWGLQVRRFIQRNNEQQQWSHWGKQEAGGPSRFGHLEGVRIGRQPRGAELLPYVVGRSAYIRPAVPNNPFNDGSVQEIRAGGDFKYHLTSNLKLDATVNPDFGQVEVDPAVVNLTAFETFFQEKRPFFVEGSGIFSFGSFNCYYCSNVSSLESFYTRRVGRAPQLQDLATGQFVDMPQNSTILGAAKITGRTGSGFTLGLMNALTRRERAEVISPTNVSSKVTVEPMTNYFVGRLKKDYRNGNLVFGAIAGSMIRDLDTGAVTRRLSKHAEMAGLDWNLTWKQKSYSFIGQMAMSSVAGDSNAILRMQRSSAHYFQRPDRRAGDNGFFSSKYDLGLTQMRGGGAYMRLAKDAGAWLWETALNTRSAGYEVNDMAFFQRADYFWHSANIFRNWSKPTKWYRQFNVITGSQEQFNYDGDLTDRQFHAFVGSQTPQFWNWNVSGQVRTNRYDDRLLRGGPVVEVPSTWFADLNFNTDSRKRILVNFDANHAVNSRGGFGTNFSVSGRYRPKPNIAVTVGPSFTKNKTLYQYVASAADPTATNFYGRRYVVSNLAQQQLALDTRLSMTFSPTMTLEVYTQPLIASGDYHNYKEFVETRSQNVAIFGKDKGTINEVKDAKGNVTGYSIDPDGSGAATAFTIPNLDFNFRSLRGNAVFRWEYKPGSTLFFVWTQARADQVPLGDFSFGRDREALFAAHPDNVFLVKLNYWLGM